MKNLTFWAIGYQHQEDVFYDIDKEDEVDGLEPTCLLPSEKLANQIIDDELGTDYVPVEVTIHSFQPNELSYSIGKVARWNN